MSNAVCSIPVKDTYLTDRVQWWDTETQCTLVVSERYLDADLWSEYGRGAVCSYRRHGVECALDRDALRTGADTVMFFVALDERGKMVAGVRAKGPLRSPDDSHAVVEWDGQSGQDAVRKMIADRVPYGVLEMKSAWVTDDPDRSRLLTSALARSGFHMMAVIDAQFCMATAATHVLNRWRSSGGVIAPIPFTPYPNHHYQTKMMWWDRSTFSRYAQPEQIARISRETFDIRERLIGAPSAVGGH